MKLPKNLYSNTMNNVIYLLKNSSYTFSVLLVNVMIMNKCLLQCVGTSWHYLGNLNVSFAFKWCISCLNKESNLYLAMPVYYTELLFIDCCNFSGIKIKNISSLIYMPAFRQIVMEFWFSHCCWKLKPIGYNTCTKVLVEPLSEINRLTITLGVGQ